MFHLNTKLVSVLCLPFAWSVCIAWSCTSVASDVDRAFAENPGWAVQVCRRMMYEKSQGLDLQTDLGRLLDAYERGRCSWTSTKGVEQTFEDVGLRLPNIDWNTKDAIPAWKSPGDPQEPSIHVEKEAAGTRVGLSPMNVSDDLLCAVSFLVLDDTPANADAKAIDFLAGQIEFFGGRKFQLTKTREITGGTAVDFWNSKKHKRYTVTQWAINQPVGRITPQVYGPLLFDVVDSEPDFMFLSTKKIALTPEFQAGCRQLCDKVLELRKAQGQINPPAAWQRVEVQENTAGVALVEIPAGKFQMRIDNRDVTVTLSRPFKLGKTEITQSQWERVMGTKPWRNSGGKSGPELPATFVSWNEATEFCKKLTQLERASGKLPAIEEYRLPTEAEWEYACRAGTTTAFSFGDDKSKLGDFAWFEGNSDDTVHNVGTRQPNPWGLYDMHGNVREFCSSVYYQELTGGAGTVDHTGAPYRVDRGGSKSAEPAYCRSADRSLCSPSKRFSATGFRVARSQSDE